MKSSHQWTITRDRFLSTEEVQRLYSRLTDARDLALQRKKNFAYVRDYFILKTLFESGLRVFELVALRVTDFNGNALIVRSGKGGKRRNILLATEAQKILRQFIKLKRDLLLEPVAPESFLFISERRKPYSTRGIRRRVKHWFKVCGFNPKLSCHSARHTYVSHLMAAGVDPVTVRDNAGHASLSTTSIYSHVVKDDLNDVELYKSEINRKETNSERKRTKD